MALEKIGWANPVKSEAVLRRAKEERNMLHIIRRREA